MSFISDWYEPGVCSVQPSSPKDYLGIDYFNELKTFNSMKSVTELHLASPTRKGRFRLDKNFATYILQNYGKTLKHLGNFIIKTKNIFINFFLSLYVLRI